LFADAEDADTFAAGGDAFRVAEKGVGPDVLQEFLFHGVFS
jgi:hypothetical protein